ncbi:hypothetical protein AB0M95_40835 [Sphaerisporangium sp. NPDC051017]|uniref:hypothetical protein n=1 Tax=Sphaerisporangium sp. NPDC051017 TaxID=3154636 RepID=UPI00341C485F
MKVRHALDLQFQAVGQDFQFHSPREGLLYKGTALQDARLVEFLVSLSDWELEDVAASRLSRIADIPMNAARAEVKRLVKAKILASDEDVEQVDTFAAAPLWSTYGWQEAFTYQVLSDSIKRIDYREPAGMELDMAMMRKYYAEEPAPPIY